MDLWPVVLTYAAFQAPEVCSTATSPLKSHQEEQNQSITPPGKGPIAGVRSPNCSRQPASVRVTRIHSPNTGASGIFYHLLNTLRLRSPSTLLICFYFFSHTQNLTVVKHSFNYWIGLMKREYPSPQVAVTFLAPCWGRRMQAAMQKAACLQYPPHYLPTVPATTECSPPTRKRSSPSDSSWTP